MNIIEKHLRIMLYILSFLLFIIGVYYKGDAFSLPTILGCTIFYALIFVDFTRNFTKSILGICVWLFIFPILFCAVLVVTVTTYFKNINQDNLFIIGLCITIILLWCIAALTLDKTKVKSSILINNALITTILSIIFLTSMDTSISQRIYDKEFINQAISMGISANSIVELVVKLLTLPYVLAAIWSAVFIELRCLGVLNIQLFKSNNINY